MMRMEPLYVQTGKGSFTNVINMSKAISMAEPKRYMNVRTVPDVLTKMSVARKSTFADMIF